MANLSISILIPVYNWDISKLLKKLDEQARTLRHRCAIEIIAIEDGSTKRFENGQTAKMLENVKYEVRSQNRGRSVLRNLLVERASGDFVLFIDADMLPDDASFIRYYWEKAQSGCDIVCGGVSYKQVTNVGSAYSFYLYKSMKTEALPGRIRREIPWRYLFSSNVLLRRKIMRSVKFDSRFTGYGFEDIEWAIRLSRSYTITHIDNSCSHMGLMTKERSFEKMRESIRNYALLSSLHPREMAKSQIVGLANFLKLLPMPMLRAADGCLSGLFRFFSRNSAAFFIFQVDKLVLLAIAFKNACQQKEI